LTGFKSFGTNDPSLRINSSSNQVAAAPVFVRPDLLTSLSCFLTVAAWHPCVLRQYVQARPFKPFTVRLADGHGVPVKHHDFVFLSPSGRTATVYYGQDDEGEVFDVLIAVWITPGLKKRRSVRRR